MSDTGSFTITVVSRPMIESLTLSNGVAAITWTAITGQTYRLQYIESFAETNWSGLSPDITASGTSAGQSDLSGLAGQRFYRVAVVP